MQESLTLTGATLLPTEHSNGGALLTTGGAHTHHTHGTKGHTHHQSTANAHVHNHTGSCCDPPPPMVLPVLTLKKPAADLVAESTDEQIYENVLQVVRMGSYDLLVELIDAWKHHRSGGTTHQTVHTKLHDYDAAGHTLTHWAAKRVDDVRIVQYFLTHIPYTPEPVDHDAPNNTQVRFPTPVHRPTRDETAMTPLHWACTQDGALAVIKALLDHAWTVANGAKAHASASSALELRDGTGCTPVLIAAQHGQVNTVAYLVQRGADVHAVDTARDSATHWAAYKGSIAVLGLLSFYDTRPLSQPDAYGQTPLHLAALRGHVSVVRYILQKLAHPDAASSDAASRATNRNLKEVLFLKDQNGRTPYELAVHKERAAVASVLQAQAVSLQPHYQTWQAYVRRSLTVESFKQFCRLRTCKVWLGLPEVDDVDESPKFPFYYVLAQIALHVVYYYTVFVPLFDPASGVLWDYLGVHVLNSMGIGVTCFCLWQCHTTNPGRLDASYKGIDVWRRLYEQTLEAFASADDAVAQKAAAVQLCHTCHIARPARSKHDRFSRACILQFDHHCPFVGTTIGLYNYKWFFLFLVALTLYLVSFLVVLAVYHSRLSGHGSTLTLLWGLFLGLHVLFPGFMLVYHVQLVMVNLTTNEHINTSKYEYFWETMGTQRRFYNPWHKGCWGNLLDRFQPGDHCYLLPEQDRASEYELLVVNKTHGACCSQKQHGHGIV